MQDAEEDGFVIVPRPGSLGFPTVPPGEHPHSVLAEIDTFINRLAGELWPLNKYIHDNPELAFEEHKAHRALTRFLESQDGWRVTESAYGLQTAWTARFDGGRPGPVISFNVEMDALPALGHACGHNLIATASLAAALATAHIMSHHLLSGSLLLVGTPGEEGYGGGKIRLLERGAYKGVDISLISHPGITNNSAMVRTTAFSRIEAEYFGRPAHAANAPWLGINALDALVMAYNSVSVLRQQTMGTDVLSLAITNGGGEATNVIHGYASGACVVRAATVSRVRVLEDKVGACFRAGAEATGAQVRMRIIRGYADHVPNSVLAESYTRCWNTLPDVPEPSTPLPGELTWVKASTDQGNISHAMPSVNASFTIPRGDSEEWGPPHSREFEKASGTEGAFRAALRVGKALSGTAVDVLIVPGLLERAKEQWERDMRAEVDGVAMGS